MDLFKAIAYDYWANQKIYQSIQEISGSDEYGEMKRFFSHLLSAQVIWYNRIENIDEKTEIWPSLSEKEISERISENPKKLKKFVDKKDEIISYQTSGGTAYTNSVEEILMHVIIHGQHHRAQIALLLRKAGQNPPPTDFIFFLRSASV